MRKNKNKIEVLDLEKIHSEDENVTGLKKRDIVKKIDKLDEKKKKKKIGFCSKVFFCYINKIFDKGVKKIFSEKHLFEMAPQQRSKFLAKSLLDYFKENKKNGFLTVFLKYAKKHFAYSIILILVGNLLQLIGPILLQKYIKWINTEADSFHILKHGLIISISSFVYYLLQGMILNNGILFSNKISTMINQSVRLLIYEKIDMMKEEYKYVFDDGTITSLIVVDAISLQNWLGVIPHIVSTPILLLFAMGYIFATLGLESLISVILLCVVSLVLFCVSKKQVTLQGKMVELLDEKSQILSEYLKECKNVRYGGLQEIYEEKIISNRDKEIKVMFQRHLYLFLIEILFFVLPVLLSVTVIPLFILQSGGEGDINETFTIITIFNILRGPMKYVYQAVIEYPRSKNASYRLKIFLNYVEEKEFKSDERKQVKVGEIFMRKCSFGIKLEKAKKVALLYKNVSITSSNKKFRRLEEKMHLFNIKSHTVLKNINLRINSGERICIVGSNSEDKSYFLKAILRSIDLTEGIFRSNGKVTYIPSSPFMLNTTIRENILLHNEFKRGKYYDILRLTGLDIDLGSFKGGDLTEIVEFGKNLSKIQTKKIGLARALYSNSDIYLMEEIFKGIINSDALYLYESGFNQILAGKTMIFVSENIEIIRKADWIIVLDKGEIKETGTYFTLSSDEKSIFYNLFCLEEQYGTNTKRKMKRRTYRLISKMTKKSNYTILSRPEEGLKNDKETELRNKFKRMNTVNEANYKNALRRGKTMMKETKKIGSVDWKTWKFYLLKNKKCLFFLTFFLFFMLSIGLISSDWFLGLWRIKKFNIGQFTYFRIYIGIILFITLNMFLRGLIYTKYTKKSSKEIHNLLMRKILRADFLWLNVTPIGRIMNRCFRDQQDVDVLLPNSLSQAIQHTSHILGYIILIMATSPFAGIFIAILMFILFLIIKKFLKTNTEMKRILARRRGKIVSYFSEVFRGNLELRSFGFEKEMRAKFCKLNDDYQNSMIHESTLSQKWLSVRTSFIGAACLFFVLFGSISTILIFSESEKLSLSLSLSWCISLVNLLWVTSLNLTKTGSLMSSVERVKEYCEEIPQMDDQFQYKNHQVSKQDIFQQSIIFRDKIKEDNFKNSTFRKLSCENEGGRVENEISFPMVKTEKLIEIRGLCMEYEKREKDAFRLQNFEMTLEKGERIALLGSAGSGKHTIFNFLTKLIRNYRYKKAKILGVDHYNYSSKKLRKEMIYLNENPSLLKGTLMENIDPFKRYKTDQIIRVFNYLDIWNFFMNGVTKRAAFDVKFKSQEALSVRVRSILQLAALNMKKGLLKKRKRTLLSIKLLGSKKSIPPSIENLNFENEMKEEEKFATLKSEHYESSDDSSYYPVDENQLRKQALMNEIHTVIEDEDEYNSFFTYNTKRMDSSSKKKKSSRSKQSPIDSHRFLLKSNNPTHKKKFMKLPLKRMKSEEIPGLNLRNHLFQKQKKKSKFGRKASTSGNKTNAQVKKSRFFRMNSQVEHKTEEDKEPSDEEESLDSVKLDSVKLDSVKREVNLTLSSFGYSNENKAVIKEEVGFESQNSLIRINRLNQSMDSSDSPKSDSGFDQYSFKSETWLEESKDISLKEEKGVKIENTFPPFDKKQFVRLNSIVIKDDPRDDERLVQTINSLAVINEKEDNKDLEELTLRMDSVLKNSMVKKIKSIIENDSDIQFQIGKVVSNKPKNISVIDEEKKETSSNTQSNMFLSEIGNSPSVFNIPSKKFIIPSRRFTPEVVLKKISGINIQKGSDLFLSNVSNLGSEKSNQDSPIMSVLRKENNSLISENKNFSQEAIHFSSRSVKRDLSLPRKNSLIDSLENSFTKSMMANIKNPLIKKTSRFKHMIVRNTTKQTSESSISEISKEPKTPSKTPKIRKKSKEESVKKSDFEILSLKAREKASRKPSKISHVSSKRSSKLTSNSIVSGVVSGEEDSSLDEMNMPVQFEKSGFNPLNQRLKRRLEKLKTKNEINQSFDCSFMYKAQYADNAELDLGLISSELQPLKEYIQGELTQEEREKFKNKLMANVDFCGINYSLKETKLIKLAIALLADPKILLFDQEALVIEDLFETALFDVVKSNFGESGMIGILNDVKYLTYFDKVICMRNGRIEESGKILDLLKNSESYLCKNLIRNEGIRSNLIDIFIEIQSRHELEVHNVFGKS